tara:strand:+ start:519 stop:965 length:447 start_codon:yes stop_codon:yes gene_type:complete
MISKLMFEKTTIISFFILSILLLSINKSNANLNNVSCENLMDKSKTNIVYGKNFAREEMSPNIWLFFQKVKLEGNNLNLISIDNDKPIREWKINLTSGEATLTPMFDPSSNWLCLNKEKQLKKLNELYKSGSLSGYEYETAKKKLLKN